MATVELTLDQILDAARQLSAEERRRLVDEVQRLPTPDAARERAQSLRGMYRMGKRKRSRMAELLAKANEGTLTGKESAELDRLVDEFESKSLQMAHALARAGKPPSVRTTGGHPD